MSVISTGRICNVTIFCNRLIVREVPFLPEVARRMIRNIHTQFLVSSCFPMYVVYRLFCKPTNFPFSRTMSGESMLELMQNITGMVRRSCAPLPTLPNFYIRLLDTFEDHSSASMVAGHSQEVQSGKSASGVLDSTQSAPTDKTSCQQNASRSKQDAQVKRLFSRAVRWPQRLICSDTMYTFELLELSSCLSCQRFHKHVTFIKPAGQLSVCGSKKILPAYC